MPATEDVEAHRPAAHLVGDTALDECVQRDGALEVGETTDEVPDQPDPVQAGRPNNSTLTRYPNRAAVIRWLRRMWAPNRSLQDPRHQCTDTESHEQSGVVRALASEHFVGDRRRDVLE